MFFQKQKTMPVRVFFILLIFYPKWTQSVEDDREPLCESNDGISFDLLQAHLKAHQDNCACDDKLCQYCLELTIPKKTQKLCFVLKHQTQNRGLKAFVDLNGKNVAGPIMISGLNPPPELMCAVLVIFNIPIKICIHVWNIYPNPEIKKLHLCVDVKWYIMPVPLDPVINVHLNCVWIDEDNIEFIEKKPVLTILNPLKDVMKAFDLEHEIKF